MDAMKRRLLLAAPLALVVALASRAGATARKRERVIRIEAKKFAYTPKRITVRKGEAVVLELTALDFAHGFSVPDLKLRVDLMPGKTVRLPIKPDQVGELVFLCDNFCGGGHEEMNGLLIVQS